ncbi:MFS transporter [Lactobacillus sp. ESL0681]|uniref:MFS transporter n=1 Tax=Lactobacillus sp. ESL0681 TaxID=2983211 RepID=UPI0023F9A663|nr:MFS transporter [Lactobacillus sp. ESL0681]WEV40858.1 MFS transporter [Lactobacillus sp. ESL0681]
MKKKQLSMAVGILSMNLLLMLATLASSAIAAIAKSFPQEPVSKVQLIGSIPQLGQIIATALFTYLTFKMTRKNLGLLAVSFVAIAGIMPAITNNSLNIILACMVLVGFGTGTITNVVPVLLQENFEGEERATVMGWASGVTNVGMMIFTALGGFLGGSNWRNLFWVYGLAFIVFLLAFFLIPQDKKLKDIGTKKEKTNYWTLFKGLNPYVYVLYIINFILSFALMAFTSNQSIVLATQGKGTAYVAGVTALGNVGGILTAAFLTYVRKFTKSNTIAWGFIAFALSFSCIAFSSNIVLHVIGNAFNGVGIVLINATAPYEMSILTDEKQFTLAVSINTLLGSLAGMVVPMILAALQIAPGYSSFIAGIIITVIAAALLLVTRFGTKVEAEQNRKTSEVVK